MRTLLVAVPKTSLALAIATAASIVAIIVVAFAALETIAVTVVAPAGSLVHADTQLTARHVSLGDTGQLLAGEVRGDVDQRESRVDLNVPDVAAVDATLARNRADDGTGLHAVLLADLDAVTRTGAGGGAAARATTSTVRAALDRSVLIAAGLESSADELTGLVQLFLAANLAVATAILRDTRSRALVSDSRGHQRRSDVFDGDLIAKFCQQALVHLETAALNAGRQALEQAAGAELGDGCRRGNLNLFHLGARQLLDAAQAAVLTRSEERERSAFTTRTASAADAMHVGLGLARNIEVNDK